MSKWYFTLEPSLDVYEAIDALLRKRASCAPVIDDGDLVGILTEKDCVRVLANSAYEDLARGTVEDYMSRSPLTIDINTDLFTAAKRFVTTNFTALPVMSGEELAGRLSRQDVLHVVQKLHGKRLKEKAREEESLETMCRPKTIAEFQRVISTQRPEHLAALLSMRHATYDE
jgi:predicted transcriptional regulator